MSCMFGRSLFNNDSLKNWNIHLVKNMNYIFYKSIFNGDVSSWDISSVKVMVSMFEESPFDGDVSKWNFNNGVECYQIFKDNECFKNKYNSGKNINDHTHYFLEWFEKNRGNIKELNFNDNDILDFFSFDNNIEKTIIIK